MVSVNTIGSILWEKQYLALKKFVLERQFSIFKEWLRIKYISRNRQNIPWLFIKIYIIIFFNNFSYLEISDIFDTRKWINNNRQDRCELWHEIKKSLSLVYDNQAVRFTKGWFYLKKTLLIQVLKDIQLFWTLPIQLARQYKKKKTLHTFPTPLPRLAKNFLIYLYIEKPYIR